MNELQFTLAESLKALALLFLALFATKALATTPRAEVSGPTGSLGLFRTAGYALTAALAIWGARGLGVEVSAGIHNFVAAGALERQEPGRAYANAMRAVELRPGVVAYWENLERSKIALHQFASALKDEGTVTAASGGELDESDALLYAWCHYDVGDYDQALAGTDALIRKNPYFAAPYVLKGLVHIAEKNYDQAEKTFISVLQMFPNDPQAVEGLAHAYYLSGNVVRAEEVLRQTEQYSFPPAARRRFEDLKRLYAQ
jgi:tetratricopeptide (TPR) repeat protein